MCATSDLSRSAHTSRSLGRLSELSVAHTVDIADLTDRTVLGEFAITAAHSTGTDYQPAQEVASNLFDAGFDGVCTECDTTRP